MKLIVLLFMCTLHYLFFENQVDFVITLTLAFFAGHEDWERVIENTVSLK